MADGGLGGGLSLYSAGIFCLWTSLATVLGHSAVPGATDFPPPPLFLGSNSVHVPCLQVKKNFYGAHFQIRAHTSYVSSKL